MVLRRQGPLIQKRRSLSDTKTVSRPDRSTGKNFTVKPTLMGQALDQASYLQPLLQVEARLAEFVPAEPYFSHIEGLAD